MSSCCCIYAYYEKNELYRENLRYFLRHGMDDPKLDYYFVLNGPCSVEIPAQSNITIVRRENRGYDFGAFSHMVHRLPREYDYYFFLNSSVRGPIFRDPHRRWTPYFLDLLDEETRLAGTSINMFGPRPCQTHIQSMFFVMDKELFRYLRDEIDFFNENHINTMDYTNIIHQKEISLSRITLRKQWNINSILHEYRGRDYRVLDEDINPTSNYGDPYYPGGYFGRTIDPYEAIFFKMARFPTLELES